MSILVLDQALVTTGWSFFRDKDLIEYGHFQIPPNGCIQDRLYAFWGELEKKESELDFDTVIFEDIQYRNNAETYKKLAFVQATLLLWCVFREKKYRIMAPSTWRRVLKEEYGVVFGKCKKEQKMMAQNFAKEKYNLESVTEDEADAICIGSAAVLSRSQKIAAF